jgi:hypothetical protein
MEFNHGYYPTINCNTTPTTSMNMLTLKKILSQNRVSWQCFEDYQESLPGGSSYEKVGIEKWIMQVIAGHTTGKPDVLEKALIQLVSTCTKNEYLIQLNELFPNADAGFLRAQIERYPVNTIASVTESIIRNKTAYPKRTQWNILTFSDLFHSDEVCIDLV